MAILGKVKFSKQQGSSLLSWELSEFFWFLACMSLICTCVIGLHAEDGPEKTGREPSSSEVLESLKRDMVAAFSTFPRENDQKARTLLFQNAKKKFEEELKSCRKSEESISDQFSRYLNNLSQSKVAFRGIEEKYKDASQVKQFYITANSKILWNDIGSASDYSMKKDHCEWFRECTSMMKKAQLLSADGAASKEASQAYTTVQKLFTEVLKASKSEGNENATENLKANMTHLRGQFPTNTEESKKANGRIAQMLEGMAQQQFKFETSSGKE